MNETQIIEVAAVVIMDPAHRVLTVRKSGTQCFMQPGGKPEAGESPLQTAQRETMEEIGLDLTEQELKPLGSFAAAAANEPGHQVVCDAFLVELAPERQSLLAQLEPAAEIAELRWWPLQQLYVRSEVAPLLTEKIAPQLRSQAASSVSG